MTESTAPHSDSTSARARFGRYGLWGWAGQFTDDQLASLDDSAVRTVWLGGSPADLSSVRSALQATRELTVVTGIVNIWNTDPATIAAEFHELDRDFPGRFYLGIGAGHREADTDYRTPLQAVNAYLDVLDDQGVAPERRLLAALGPAMLRLAGERSVGAHPYLVPTRHSAIARDELGPGPLLAPEHKIAIAADTESARAAARSFVGPYFGLSNYANNLLRLGFSEQDLASQSDELVDALVVHGEPADLRAGIDEHLTAGADHVAVQVIGADNPAAALAQLLTT